MKRPTHPPQATTTPATKEPVIVSLSIQRSLTEEVKSTARKTGESILSIIQRAMIAGMATN